jgi:hypothetical protein
VAIDNSGTSNEKRFTRNESVDRSHSGWQDFPLEIETEASIHCFAKEIKG